MAKGKGGRLTKNMKSGSFKEYVKCKIKGCNVSYFGDTKQVHKLFDMHMKIIHVSPDAPKIKV